MSENKKQTTTKGSETGKNRSYFNIPDPCTEDGTGAMEQVLLAFGQNQPETHWRNHRKHNPYAQAGYQRHYSAQTDGGLVLEDAARNFNSSGKHTIFGIENTKKNSVVVKDFFTKIAIPSMKKRQQARLLNKSGTKAEKAARTMAAQYEEWTNNPDALTDYVVDKHSGTLEQMKATFAENPIYTKEIIDAFVSDTIKSMAQEEMLKRNPKHKI